MRKAPVYLLIDTSGSMFGESIIAVENGIKTCIEALRTDAESLEKAHVCIITFSSKAEVLIPLTYIQDFPAIPKLKASGETYMGEAVNILNQRIESDIASNTSESKGDYKAHVFLLTDGYPTDIKVLKDVIQKINKKKIKYFIAATTDEKTRDSLKETLNCDEVIYLPSCDTNTLKKFFIWVSQSVSASISRPQNDDNHGDTPIGELPPLPNFNDSDDSLLL